MCFRTTFIRVRDTMIMRVTINLMSIDVSKYHINTSIVSTHLYLESIANQSAGSVYNLYAFLVPR